MTTASSRTLPSTIRRLSLVVPCYDEEQCLPLFLPAVLAGIESIEGLEYEFVFVNDGSRDRTLDILTGLALADPRVRIVDFSRNFGKEAALTAGMKEATGDLVVPFDADLQDPPAVIADLVGKWREGFDVVIARRADRSSDGHLKRGSASMFYRLHNRVADIEIPENAGDFRLMTRQVVDALNDMPENCRFMKGLFAWAGFRTAVVDYVRQPRSAGTSKFSGWKLWNFALEGITSFSTLPLRIWTYFGALVAFVSIAYAFAVIVRTLIFGIDMPGYASIVSIMLFLGGVHMVGIGIVGEYVGRIYIESKRRPLYIVRDRISRQAEPVGSDRTLDSDRALEFGPRP